MRKLLVSVLLVVCMGSLCFAEELTENADDLSPDVSVDSQDLNEIDVSNLEDRSDEVNNASGGEVDMLGKEYGDVTLDDFRRALEEEMGMTIEEHNQMMEDAEKKGENPMEYTVKNDFISFYVNDMFNMAGTGASLYFEAVNNFEEDVTYSFFGISVNGFVVDLDRTLELKAGEYTSGVFLIDESLYKPFGIKTDDIRDIEFYVSVTRSRSASGVLLFDYVQSHMDKDSWNVEYDGEVPGSVIFDTPEVTIKAYGTVEGWPISQVFTYENHTNDELLVELPKSKYNDTVSGESLFFRIPQNKSGYKNIIWQKEEAEGENSIVTNIRVTDLSNQNASSAEEETEVSDDDTPLRGSDVILDKNVKIVLK